MVLAIASQPVQVGRTHRFSNLGSVDLYITGRCNRRCAYCFLPAEFLDSATSMPIALARQVIAWAARSNVGEVTILGGEPSLARDFTGILNAVADAGLDARVVTNGSSRMRALLKSGAVHSGNVGRIAVSLDSMDATAQDRLRGHGAHSDALSTIEQVRQAGIAFDVNVTATTTSIAGIWDLIGFAEESGCRRVNVHWPSTMGLGAGLPVDEIPSSEAWHSLVAAVGAYRPTRPGFFVEIERAFLAPGESLSGCALVEATNLQVMPDGRAYRCGLLVDDPEMASLRFVNGLVTVGSLRDGEEGLRQMVFDCKSCPALATSPDGEGRACIYDKITSVRR